jgi:hypothetical protein
MQHTEKNAEKRSAESNRQISSQRAEKAEQEVTRLIDNLPEPWRSHPAQEDEDEFQLLKAEWESLEEAPDQAKNLRMAQREANVVQGTITTLESQLVERFVSPFQVKLLVAGKVEAHRAAVQMVWDAG